MNATTHILIVDDDARVRRMLNGYLTDEGITVTEAENGQQMRAAMAREAISLVLLDLVMPGEDGLDLAREIRQTSRVPIIILTGKGDVVDRIVGLEIGADDYIAKPFHLREILARIRTVLRRSTASDDQETSAVDDNRPRTEVVSFDGWKLDLTRRELTAPDGRAVDLTTGEFELLRVFTDNASRVLNRDQLMDQAKGRDWTPYDRSVDTQVARLRKKVERDPKKPELIKTVRGVGYSFTATVARDPA